MTVIFWIKSLQKVVEIDRSHVTVFNGNYTDYAMKKSMLRDAELKQYINQQREIRHQEEVIAKLRSFNRENPSNVPTAGRKCWIR